LRKSNTQLNALISQDKMFTLRHRYVKQKNSEQTNQLLFVHVRSKQEKYGIVVSLILSRTRKSRRWRRILTPVVTPPQNCYGLWSLDVHRKLNEQVKSYSTFYRCRSQTCCCLRMSTWKSFYGFARKSNRSRASANRRRAPAVVTSRWLAVESSLSLYLSVRSCLHAHPPPAESCPLKADYSLQFYW